MPATGATKKKQKPCCAKSFVINCFTGRARNIKDTVAKATASNMNLNLVGQLTNIRMSGTKAEPRTMHKAAAAGTTLTATSSAILADTTQGACDASGSGGSGERGGGGRGRGGESGRRDIAITGGCGGSGLCGSGGSGSSAAQSSGSSSGSAPDNTCHIR